MGPLASFKPPVMNDQRHGLLNDVHSALNDIDRRELRRITEKTQRELIPKYQAVGEKFASRAIELGFSDWLAYTILERQFVMGLRNISLDGLREMYSRMEHLGFPNVNSLISARMVWVNRLMEDGSVNEARGIARQLLIDVEAFQKLHPGVLVSELDQDLGELCRRVGI